MSLSSQSEINPPRELSGVDRLWGEGAFLRLQACMVAVIGIGGVGSWCAEALARSAIGQLVLIDLDHVSASNVNRQLIATRQTLGQAKVLSMKERIESIHSWCQIHTIEEMLSDDNGQQVLDQVFTLAGTRPLVIIDCCDDMAAKTWLALQFLHHIHTATSHHQWKLIVSGAAGGKRHPHMIRLADMSHVTHDPLISNLRRRIKALLQPAGIPDSLMSSIDCVYSVEPVQKPTQGGCDPAAKLHCAGYGSSVMVTSSFGLTAAACAVDWLNSQTS